MAITIKNTGSAPINCWSLPWTWDGSQHQNAMLTTNISGSNPAPAAV